MEGVNLGVGPTTSNTRPIRAASSRYFSYGPHSGNHSGPVRRWQKKWVHVSPPQPSTKKNTRSKPPHSNLPKSSPLNSPILLCKWTPLSPSPAADADAGGVVSGELPRRKFRYTPIAVVKEQKMVTAKRVADQDFAETTHLSEERPAMDIDGSYRMLDINNDLTESPQPGLDEKRCKCADTTYKNGNQQVPSNISLFKEKLS